MSKERITLAELADQMRELREGLFALRADLSGIMEDAKTLANRRKKDMERKRLSRAAVRGQAESVHGQERKEGEERNLSPTPPIKREEGERKEVCLSSTCVCAHPMRGRPSKHHPAAHS